MGHRLPFHKGLCKNVHGHSYKMVVEITGEINESGMIIDFYDLNRIIDPIIEKYDHAFLCWENDKDLKEFLIKHKMKRVFVSYHSTVENICSDFQEKIASKMKRLKGNKIKALSVKIFETPNSFAEKSISLA